VAHTRADIATLSSELAHVRLSGPESGLGFQALSLSLSLSLSLAPGQIS